MSIITSPASEYFQGDIFADVPFAYVRSLDFVQPSDAARTKFTATPLPATGNKAHVVAPCSRSMGMLVTHECIIDKGGRAPWSFARIVRISVEGAEGQQAIRTGTNYQAFHLPKTAGILDEESYVDFRLITAVDPALARDLIRIASLSTEGRASLKQQLILYWTRVEPGV
ncbi:MAG TPA: hypothetical protein VGL91_19325 [Acidobacteriota bacterium]